MGKYGLDPKKQTLKVSVLFFIIFTAMNSFLTILTFIYEQAELTAIGPANIAVSYMAFILSTLYAPSCPWKIKTQMLVGTLAYTLNFSTGLLIPYVSVPFKFSLTCIGAAVCGLSAGLLWVSQGRYIHLVCESRLQEQPNLKEKCFGLFSLIYCMSHISAGFITTFGLGLFNVEIYFITITATGLLSVIFCIFAINDVNPQSNKDLEEPLNPEIITPQLAGSALDNTERDNNQNVDPMNQNSSGTNNGIICRSDNVNPSSQNSISNTIVNENPREQGSIRQIFRYYPKMSSILCILVIDGLCYGIHISEITHMIPEDTPADKLNLYAGFCNIALGCGASLGGWTSGLIGAKYGGKRSGDIGILMFLLGSLLALTSLEVQAFWLTLISVFVWGFFLFYIEGWLFIICSREFKGRSESFSVNKQLGSITCFLFQILVMFTNNTLNLSVVIGVVAALSIPAFQTLRKLPSTRQQNHITQSTI